MSDSSWASTSLANLVVDESYASVKGYVRTYVLNQHLLATCHHRPPGFWM